jgi:hypothetical protein
MNDVDDRVNQALKSIYFGTACTCVAWPCGAQGVNNPKRHDPFVILSLLSTSHIKPMLMCNIYSVTIRHILGQIIWVELQ